MSEIVKRYVEDDAFRDVMNALYGPAADDLVSKASPDGADLSASARRKKREQTEARIGLATNVIGLGAGAAATPGAFRAVGEARRNLPGAAGKHRGDWKSTAKLRNTIRDAKGGSVAAKGKLKAMKTLRKPKVALAVAGGAAGLQVANLGGDVVANRVLSRSAKKDPTVKGGAKALAIETKKKTNDFGVSKGAFVPVSKAMPPYRNRRRRQPRVGTLRRMRWDAGVAMNSKARMAREGAETIAAARKGVKAATVAGVGGAALGGLAVGDNIRQRKKFKELKAHVESIGKNEAYDVTWEGEFSKVDSDKRQVFGWASIVEMNGEPVVDLQGDYIAIDEVEKSAYEYVHKSRKGGDMHLRDGDQAVHKSDMIESFVVTPEKKDALGLPDDTPVGWWVGYQINDDELWHKVKSGKRTGFSIHGRGVRSPA